LEREKILRAAFDRPLKIVGVVKNTGEPGGGPFVIEHEQHRILSIVEKDEISADQRQMMQDGEFDKSGYRKFKLKGKSANKPDDTGNLKEVLERRYSRVIREGLDRPDLKFPILCLEI